MSAVMMEGAPARLGGARGHVAPRMRYSVPVGTLIELVGYLRARQEPTIAYETWPLLLKASENLVSRLDSHLREGDLRLFPSLRGAAPSLSGRLEELSREHAEFRARARDLAARISVGDMVEAVEDARFLLAWMIDHAKREGWVLREPERPYARSKRRPDR